MKNILRIFTVYIGVAFLITFAKTCFNLWYYWFDLTVLEGLPKTDAVIICILNGLMFGIPLAALILMFLSTHSLWTSFRVTWQNKRIKRRKNNI